MEWDIITDPEDIKNIVRYEQICRHKFDNINEWINSFKSTDYHS